jgi:tetratricopeptide (TPR) repeat protein
MAEYLMGLEILAWAPAVPPNDWLRAELLVHARRFVEGLEHLKHLEVRYVDDPETSFAVSYLKAQCLQELGQKDAALEILKSIVRVRPNYRSAHALIQEWTEGASWE